MEQLTDWAPTGVRVVTDRDGRVALIDDRSFLLVGPVLLTDRAGVGELCDWLCGYLLDTN